MNELDTLLGEIDRYLAAVALFRALGCEPRWQPEVTSSLVVRVREWLDPREQRMSRR